jgi:hypothetical protein
MIKASNNRWNLGWLGGVNWLRISLQHDVDPYAVWAMAVEFRDFGQVTPGVLNLIAELKQPLRGENSGEYFFLLNNPAKPVTSVARTGRKMIDGHIPAAYFDAYPDQKTKTKFVSLRLKTAPEKAKPGEGNKVLAKALKALILNADIQRVQLGYPRGTPDSDKPLGKEPIKGPEEGQASPAVLLAAIDNTCPFFHSSLRKDPMAPGTRVAALWDQTTIARFDAPGAPTNFPYGQQWLKAQLDTFVSERMHDEEHVADDWERIGVKKGRFASLRPRASHGAAVLGLLAGHEGRRLLPLDGVLPGEGHMPEPNEKQRDEAAKAPLGMVQLPREQTQIASGRWLAPNVIDALRYLLHWGWTYRQNGGQPPPMVVNISHGAQAGPHDGTGILEAAMAEMRKHYGADLALVLAAGNSHGTRRDPEDEDQYLPSGVHAKASLNPQQVNARFHLRLPHDKQNTTAVEIWFDRILDAGDLVVIRAWRPGRSAGPADLRISMPDVNWWVKKSQDGTECDVLAGLIGMARAPQASNRSMALLMIAATQQSTTRVEVPAGVWVIEVEARRLGSVALGVDVWVERDGTVVGARRGQQARLVDVDPSSNAQLTDENTFTHIATSDQTYAVTALQRRASMGPPAVDKASTYSSEGTGKREPDFSTLVDPLRTAHGMRVMGNRTGVVVRANGTSLAAPQAARWIANQLAGGTKLTDIDKEIKKAPRTNRVGKVVP